MTDRELMQQALEAVEFYACGDEIDEALITALRERLAQPERVNQCGETCERAKLCATCARGLDEQPEQEPVAWMCSDFDLMHRGYSRFSPTRQGDWNIPVYTAPPRREWVGLTDEAVWNVYKNLWIFHPAEEPRLAGDILKFYRAIEAKLKEKNT